jgi:hypothetical protein
MEKNTIFTLTTSNGAEVTAVVVAIISSSKYQTEVLCYAQNMLFTLYEHIAYDIETGEPESDYSYGEVLCDYAILPEYDDILKSVTL